MIKLYDNENEIWKDIPEYEGIYEASNMGRIRTKEGKTTKTDRHGTRYWKSRILKTRGTNYLTGHRVSLWKDGKPKDWLIARLVALTFLGVPKTKLTVNHKDGNRFNNNINNLEWLTLADNIRHGFDSGLYPQIKITLLNQKNNQMYSFQSLSKASSFLDRNHGYLCKTIKLKRIITNKEGIEFKIIS